MQVLFQQWVLYCSSCEDGVESEDPWDIEYNHPDDCACEPKYHYTSTSRVWCRSCGKHVVTVGKS
jgi:hypothetical protein